MTSCVILSCASEKPAPWPMRLAGTCSRYSNSAMPQLMSAAMNHDFVASPLRWPYQAKVMKTLDSSSKPTVCQPARVENIVKSPFSKRQRPEALDALSQPALARGEMRQLRGDLQQRAQHEGALAEP